MVGNTVRSARPAGRSGGLLAVVRGGAFALLAGHLLFAHGCHGDEDHELFGALRRLRGPRRLGDAPSGLGGGYPGGTANGGAGGGLAGCDGAGK